MVKTCKTAALVVSVVFLLANVLGCGESSSTARRSGATAGSEGSRLASTSQAKREAAVKVAAQINKADWMSEIFSKNPTVKLKDIAIPGTHNSATYAISSSSSVVAQSSSFLGYPIVSHVTAGWARCQDRSLTEQLSDGVRFFDLRVAFDSSGTAVIAHTLVSITLQEAIAQFKAFSDQHPKEIILISIKLFHDYDTSLSAPEKITKLRQAKDMVAGGLTRVSRGLSSQDVSLKDLWEQNTSVIILEKSDFATQWFNVRSSGDLHARASSYLSSVGDSRLSELSLILTPNGKDIAYNFPVVGEVIEIGEKGVDGAGSVIDTIGDGLGSAVDFVGGLFLVNSIDSALYDWEEDTLNQLPGWIDEWVKAGRTLNIVSFDFYHRTNVVGKLMELNELRAQQ